MPHIAITMLPGRGKEVKKKLAENIRQFLSQELDIDKNIISVSIRIKYTLYDLRF